MALWSNTNELCHYDPIQMNYGTMIQYKWTMIQYKWTMALWSNTNELWHYDPIQMNYGTMIQYNISEETPVSRIHVIVRVHMSVSSRLRARCFSMVKIRNKCILSILVYNLFWDRQRNILYTPQYFHTPVYRPSSWNRLNISKNLISAIK